MTKYFATTPAPIAGNNVIATADNGRVFTENNELHIETDERHYVYKHNIAPVGWYMVNPDTSESHYLGEGASPTADFTNLVVADADIWATIEMPEQPVEHIDDNNDASEE